MYKITKFESLEDAVKKFGIQGISKIEIQSQNEKFETEGLDKSESDIFKTNNNEIFTILQDGSIVKAIIHIVDISNYLPQKYPKFHIYNCRTIIDMEKNHKGYRYKLSGRKDGIFYIIKKQQTRYEKLEVCKNCLSQYNKKFNSNKEVSNFIVKEYLDEPIQHTKFTKMDLDICTVPNAYANNWHKISKIIKKRCRYICQKCFFDCSSKQFRGFLHTHHQNANTRDNRRENLKALCIKCHSEEHNHGHIKSFSQYKQFIELKRKSVA